MGAFPRKSEYLRRLADQMPPKWRGLFRCWWRSRRDVNFRADDVSETTPMTLVKPPGCRRWRFDFWFETVYCCVFYQGSAFRCSITDFALHICLVMCVSIRSNRVFSKNRILFAYLFAHGLVYLRSFSPGNVIQNFRKNLDSLFLHISPT